jgi:CHAD domain-containing protein
VEVELKYRVVASGAADRYLNGDELAGFAPTGQVRAVQHDDRYVDTPDGALARAGFGARLRQAGNGLFISVKSLGRNGGSGPHRREELEGPADRGLPPSDWPPSAARSLVLELAGDAPLVEVVTVRQLRRKREFRRDGAAVEVSLDEVDVVVRGDVVERFEELEVEMVEGDDEALDALGAVLGAAKGLEPAETSKLERALEAAHRERDGKPGLAEAVLARARDGRAAGGRQAQRSKASRGGKSAPHPTADDMPVAVETAGDPSAAPTPEPERETEAEIEAVALAPATPPPLHVGKAPGVVADDHLAEAGRKVLRFHLARMLAVEPGTRSGEDPEDLHKMRVATRRQRAAWRVFGEAYDPKRTKRHRNRLRDVARRLGAVRDLDVLIEHGLAYAAEQSEPERLGIEPLFASWRAHREEARALLIKELDSPKHLDWLDDYREFVQAEGRAALPVSPTEPHRVRDSMPSRIWAAYEHVRAYEPVLRWADIPTMHELRISGKWLRYTLEFVREALGPDSAPLIARVTALQDHLGLLNDADVSANLARQFLVEHAGELDAAESAAIGRFLMAREADRARLRRTIGPAWRGVAGLAYRRQLAKVIAGL